MRKFLMISIFALFALVTYGQKVPLDLDKIRKFAKTDSYDKLYQQYLANDTTLSLEDYVNIYYGQAFLDSYQPNARPDSVKELNTYLNTAGESIDFQKVLQYTQPILQKFPFNIEQILITAVAHEKLGNQGLSQRWFYKYDKLIRTILSSGDGKSEETAMVVTKVTDEYSILEALQLEFTSQTLTGNIKKKYDVMEVAPNNIGINQLYFDINLFYGKW